MLTYLDIRGLLLIDKVQVTFGCGLHVVTGETGAGKSILIRALHLLLGSKASGDCVAEGASLASVSASFKLPEEHEGIGFLASLGIEPLEGDINLLVRRTISSKGRSQCWVNDTQITLSTLKELGFTLIDIFAQHDNQQLLNEANHSAQVDAFLPNKRLKKAYKSNFKTLSQNYSALRERLSKHSEKVLNRDFLEFRCQQIRELSPSVEDYMNLVAYCQEAEQHCESRQHLVDSAQHIETGFEGKPLSQGVWACLRALDRIPTPDSEQKRIKIELKEVGTRLDDLGFDLAQNLSGTDIDSPRLEAGQARLSNYQQLMRKLGINSIEDLIQTEQNNLRELQAIESAGENFADDLIRLSKDCDKISELGKKLSIERRKAATDIQNKAKGEFADLAMKNTQLSTEFVSFTKTSSRQLDFSSLGEDFTIQYQKSIDLIESMISTHKEEGREKARFLLSTNPGQPLKPLAKVASGGEISRIMLALKRVLLGDASSCVLVFDEIDTGISGRIADMVGKKLREMSLKTQVICISHLAQVASYAHHHLQVEKTSNLQLETSVHLKKLIGSERTNEIAKLLSGEEVTPLSIANAKSLLDRCKNDS